jgi:hypothetical protein
LCWCLHCSPCGQHLLGAQHPACTLLEIRFFLDLLVQLAMPSPTHCPCSHQM